MLGPGFQKGHRIECGWDAGKAGFRDHLGVEWVGYCKPKLKSSEENHVCDCLAPYCLGASFQELSATSALWETKVGDPFSPSLGGTWVGGLGEGGGVAALGTRTQAKGTDRDPPSFWRRGFGEGFNINSARGVLQRTLSALSEHRTR